MPGGTSIRFENSLQVGCIQGALDPRLDAFRIRRENALPNGGRYDAETFLEEAGEDLGFAFRFTFGKPLGLTLVVVRLSQPSHDSLLSVGHESFQRIVLQESPQLRLDRKIRVLHRRQIDQRVTKGRQVRP